MKIICRGLKILSNFSMDRNNLQHPRHADAPKKQEQALINTGLANARKLNFGSDDTHER